MYVARCQRPLPNSASTSASWFPLDTLLHKRVVAKFNDLRNDGECRLVAGHMPDSGLPEMAALNVRRVGSQCRR